MIRFGRLNFALALLVVLPTVASAQKDSKYTKEAEKYVGLAMTRADEAQRAAMYKQAMTHLREGMERDANNAKVWLLAGTVHAGLGELREADEAFKRAVEMHPAYAEEVAGEREAAWVDAFNAGIELMDQQNYPEAIRMMEAAQLIYDQRPEALMNLGALYANQGDNTKAADAFERAMASTRGPVYDQLDAEQKAAWDRFRDMARLNVAQIVAAEGVDAFTAEQFDKAEQQFTKATELNAHARDYWFNYVQAIWAQTSPLEDALEAGGPAADEAKAKLLPLYERVEKAAQRARQVDPNSEVLYLIEARANKVRSDIATAEAEKTAWQQKALAVLEEHDRLLVTLDNLQIYTDGDGVAIGGELKNRKATDGAPIRIEFTFVDLEGNTIGTETVTVNAPAADATTEFKGRGTVNGGELAGWRYRVVS